MNKWKRAFSILLIINILGLITYSTWFYITTSKPKYFTVTTNQDETRNFRFSIMKIGKHHGFEGYTGRKVSWLEYGLYNLRIFETQTNTTLLETWIILNDRYVEMYFEIIENKIVSTQIKGI